MNCSSEDQYDKDGKCCDRCPAGEYAQEECDGSKLTKCAKCEHGLYTATKNHLNKCQVCSVCGSNNNKRPASACTATQNTVCECNTGFYCSSDQCDHCLPLTKCSEGEGVIRQANRTTDADCAPCKVGTYSNVTDFHSICKPHTKCEELGRALKVAGTVETDAVCGDVLPRCSWMLPAGLWSGLVLTALILFAVVICRRAKRRSYNAGKTSVPVTLTEVVPAPLPISLELPLPATELNGHCQESCKLPLFNPDENLVSCSMDSSLPITPFKASVSFVDSCHTNGSFLRTYSEPQEDEWCGT